METKFKAGDRVRCIRADASGDIKVRKGKILIVNQCGSSVFRAEDGTWWVDRFELVNPRKTLQSPLEYLKSQVSGSHLIDASAMLRDCFGLEVRRIPATVEFVPIGTTA